MSIPVALSMSKRLASSSCLISDWMKSQRRWDDCPPVSSGSCCTTPGCCCWWGRELHPPRMTSPGSLVQSSTGWRARDVGMTAHQFLQGPVVPVWQTASSSSDDIARASCPTSDWMKSQRRWYDCPPVSEVQLNWTCTTASKLEDFLPQQYFYWHLLTDFPSFFGD